MKRRLLNLLTVLSLLLCVAVVALWVCVPRGRPARFYTSAHRYSAHWTIDSVWLEVTAGVRDAHGGFRAPPGQGWASKWDWPQPLPLGFGYGRSPAGDPGAAFYRGVALPWWFVFTAPSLLPAWRLGAWYLSQRQRRRASANKLCPSCGYDLRATPDKCPECGNIPPSLPCR
jgi:hypothetical protein